MITISNFTQACQLQAEGQIPFRLLQEQAMLFVHLGADIDATDALEITTEHIQYLLGNEESEADYGGMFGGDVHVCEAEEDLKQVVGMDMAFARSHGNRWPDVTDQVMSWDDCRYLPEKDGDPQWALFFLAWNNAGGNSFFVPRKLWGTARVAEHVAETDQFWGAQ
jgi:hypothetical protein